MLTKPIPLFDRLLLELQANCNRACFFCNRTWDDSGKRLVNGKHVLKKMPTEHALRILDEAAAIGFRGRVAFHHMSEPFLDPRIIDMAQRARVLGMHPYEHTNGDVLRSNDDLCKAAVEVFEYIVVGLYDHASTEERDAEMAFWRQRLAGTDVRFSSVDHVFPRNLTPQDERMFRNKHAHASGRCRRPLKRMIVHYDGNMALCCEDMKDDFGLGNAFETPLSDLWYSAKHVQVIADLERGQREKYKLCASCPIPPPEEFSFPERILGKARRLGGELITYLRPR